MLDWANRLLPEIAPGTVPASSVRSVPGALEVTATSPAGLTAAWLDALAAASAEEGSVGLVVADAAVAATEAELERNRIAFEQVDRFDVTAGVTLVPASAAKGLEFDQVVLVEPAAVAATTGPRGRRRGGGSVRALPWDLLEAGEWSGWATGGGPNLRHRIAEMDSSVHTRYRLFP